MIDSKQAIIYIKQVVEQLELADDKLHRENLEIEAQKKQIVLDRETLTARKTAFLQETKGYGAEVERVTALHSLAKKMKAQADDEMGEIVKKEAEIEKREAKVSKLEQKQQELEDREKLIEQLEADLVEREEFVAKDKVALRTKQEDLELREKSIKKQHDKLQQMIDAQRL